MRKSGLGLIGMAAALLLGIGVRGESEAKPGVSKMVYGKTSDGAAVEQYEMRNSKGMVVKLITYGAAISELWVPDREGKLADVNLGFDSMEGWQGKTNPYFGCIVGRYANRIAGGKFSVDGKDYRIATNNGPNHLHGGVRGFDKAIWKARVLEGDKAPFKIAFTHVSPDGDEGYPGEVTAEVIYSLSDDNELGIEYKATTTKATPINLTNHAYFNLSGHNAGSILDHEIRIMADKVTAADDTLIPTGKLQDVKDTPYDFTASRKIGARIGDIKGDPGGYDINYVLASGGGKLTLGARVVDPKSGRIMEMLTTEPGVQFYTGNFLDGSTTGKGKAVYRKNAGFCLEAQHFPDSPNQPTFP
ncbi:MAG: aldose epimerase family protein, partial [Gemmataceae bacterium]